MKKKILQYNSTNETSNYKANYQNYTAEYDSEM